MCRYDGRSPREVTFIVDALATNTTVTQLSFYTEYVSIEQIESLSTYISSSASLRAVSF